MLTTEELFREYVKLFKLLVETAGYTVKNKSYLEVERILQKQEKNIKATIEDDIPFTPFVATLIFYIILDIHGADRLEGVEKTEEVKNLIDDFWERYLKRPTRKFTSKYGLPEVRDLETYITVLGKSYYEKF
jgi:hypothetical protein